MLLFISTQAPIHKSGSYILFPSSPHYSMNSLLNDSLLAGIRKQIFIPMARNSDGHYELDGSFITGNEQVKCDAEFSSRVYDKVQILKYSLSTTESQLDSMMTMSMAKLRTAQQVSEFKWVPKLQLPSSSTRRVVKIICIFVLELSLNVWDNHKLSFIYDYDTLLILLFIFFFMTTQHP